MRCSSTHNLFWVALDSDLSSKGQTLGSSVQFWIAAVVSYFLSLFPSYERYHEHH